MPGLLSAPLLARLNGKKQLLDTQRPLSPAVLANLRAKLAVAWTHHSTAIEGNTLTLEETALVIDYGFTVKGKSLREHLEVTDHHEAVGWVYQWVAQPHPLTLDQVLELHHLVLRKSDTENAGRLRSQQVFIRGTRYVPPPASVVPQLLEEWLAWVNGPAYPKRHPVEAAALAKQGFVSLHPFLDGNGRVSRLLMNLLLMRAEFPPAVILLRDRAAYIRAVERSHWEGDEKARYGPLIELVGRAVDDGLMLYLQALNRIPVLENDPGLVPLPELAAQVGTTPAYLRVLVARGQLQAVQRGRRWYSSPDAWARSRSQMRAPGRPAAEG